MNGLGDFLNGEEAITISVVSLEPDFDIIEAYRDLHGIIEETLGFLGVKEPVIVGVVVLHDPLGVLLEFSLGLVNWVVIVLRTVVNWVGIIIIGVVIAAIGVVIVVSLIVLSLIVVGLSRDCRLFPSGLKGECGSFEGSRVGGHSEVWVLALGDAEISGEQPRVLNDTAGEQFDVALLGAIIVLLVNKGGVVNSVPDPSVLSGMLSAVESDTGHVVWVLDNALIDSVLVVCGPELLDIRGNINI